MINFSISDSLYLNSILTRHTPNSNLTHWTISNDDLLFRIRQSGEYEKNQIAGYRDGVLLIKINPQDFFSPIIELKEGMKIHGDFIKRKEGEEPRRESYTFGDKSKAKTVFICLYHNSVLIEKNENESNCDWEVITVLASPTLDSEPTPMPVGTLLANHFEFSGGTSTKMSNDEFVEALRKSANYWKNKIKCRQFLFV